MIRPNQRRPNIGRVQTWNCPFCVRYKKGRTFSMVLSFSEGIASLMPATCTFGYGIP